MQKLTKASPPSTWRVPDVVDFEFFLEEDKARGEQEVAERDRAISSEDIIPRPASQNLGSREKIRLWLDARREEYCERGQELPGQFFREAYDSVLAALCLGGAALGAGIASSHFYYYGERPISVLIFLSFTVLPQLLLLAMAGAGLFFRNTVRSFQGFALFRWISRSVLVRLAEARETAVNHMRGESRLRFRAAWGALQGKQTIYGTLWLWPMLVLTQAFAVCFNIAVIATMLLLVTVSNRAFGWETTLHTGPEAMYGFIKAIAFPWSWLPYAHPTLEQVIGSRISLNGPSSYSNEALVSWWPFLCYAVFFYGFLPRAVLLGAACVRHRRSLDALRFDHADCNQLIRRMTPIVNAGPPGPELSSVTIPDEAALPSPGSNRCVTIVSDDLSFPAALLDLCLGRLGWKTWQRTSAEVDCADANQELFGMLGGIDWNGEQPRIVVAMDAARPPIKGILLFLQKVRSVGGSNAVITVLLAASANSKDEYSTIWKQRIATLRDPFLNVEFGTCE